MGVEVSLAAGSSRALGRDGQAQRRSLGDVKNTAATTCLPENPLLCC